MADWKVSALTALGQSGFADGDTFYVVDVSVSGLAGSKKTTVADVLGDGTNRMITSPGAGSIVICTACTFLNTPTGSSATSNFLNITGTQPTTLTALFQAVLIQIASAGSSSFSPVGAAINLSAGYTGSSATFALTLSNGTAGTGTAIIGSHNNGFQSSCGGTTAGTNVACYAFASGGNINIGGAFRATNAKNSATNIGVFGAALNTGSAPVQVAGYFALVNSDPTISTSCALFADNGTTTSSIFIAADSGTAVFTIADGGGITGTATWTTTTLNGTTAVQSNGTQINYNLTVYAAGTAYSLTNTAAALDFGTTDPSLTLNVAGTYTLRATVNLKYNAATFAANRTATLKLRRTNNTAADVTGATTAVVTAIVTTFTSTFLVVQIPEVIYTTANTNDAIAIFGSVDTVPSAGSLDAVEASIVAVRIY